MLRSRHGELMRHSEKRETECGLYREKIAALEKDVKAAEVSSLQHQRRQISSTPCLATAHVIQSCWTPWHDARRQLAVKFHISTMTMIVIRLINIITKIIIIIGETRGPCCTVPV
jgi:hypothetical protein